MSEAMAGCGISRRTRVPGVVLTHLAVAIADGADCLSDLAALEVRHRAHARVEDRARNWKNTGLVGELRERRMWALQRTWPLP